MSLLNSYKQLFRQTDLRKKTSEQELASLRRQQDVSEKKEQQIQNEISFQKQLISTQTLHGEVSKDVLYTWLRRNAMMRKKAQDLQLNLQNQKEMTAKREEAVAQQRLVCKKLEKKKEKYTDLVKKERKKIALKAIYLEETEIEERVSWVR